MGALDVGARPLLPRVAPRDGMEGGNRFLGKPEYHPLLGELVIAFWREMWGSIPHKAIDGKSNQIPSVSLGVHFWFESELFVNTLSALKPCSASALSRPGFTQ